jgi:hypothetical protein
MRGRLACAAATAVWIAAAPSGIAAVPHASGPPVAAERFLNHTQPPLVSYRALRKLSASNKRYNVSGWLHVRTEFDVERGFRYEILAEGGSGAIRNRVLRKVLEREKRAREASQAARAWLTAENYQFGEAAVEEDGLVRIAVSARRKEELLVNGSIVVTSPDAELVRIEGRLARNPSVWTRRVDIVRRYGVVNGVRVPLETLSTAQIMLVGTSSFTMCYDYEMVNGTAVESRMSCL